MMKIHAAFSSNNALQIFTYFHKSLDSAGHGELFAMCRTRLLGDCVLWQTPSFLHHQLLEERYTNFFLLK